MSKIEQLETAVRQLYAAKNPERDGWADWLADNHVFVVANNATTLAKRFGADPALARAAALLHDVADATMSRFNDEHENTSLQLARQFMEAAGFTTDEITLVVDDAIRYHGCHDGQAPTSLEGKVLAAADSMAHLQTDYYIRGAWAFGARQQSLQDSKAWTLKKIERDFNAKILFPEVKAECAADYDRIKTLFSR